MLDQLDMLTVDFVNQPSTRFTSPSGFCRAHCVVIGIHNRWTGNTTIKISDSFAVAQARQTIRSYQLRYDGCVEEDLEL